MEIYTVIIHDAANKWVKGKPDPADKMREKHDPLMGPGGGDALPLVWKPVRDVVRQVSGLPQLFDLPLRDGGGHPSTSRSGHGWRRLRWEVRAWALELERAGTNKQRRKKA